MRVASIARRWWRDGFGQRWSRAQRGARIRAGLLVTAVVVYAVLAAVAQGSPTADVHLNDGSVWVTRSSQDQVARLDHPVEQLDASVTPIGGSPGVLQDGYTVFTYQKSLGRLRPVDVAAVTLGTTIKVPPGADVSLGGGTFAISSQGRAWIVPASQVSSLDLGHPTLSGLGTDVSGYGVVAGTDGVAHAYSVTTQTMENLSFGPDGSLVHSSERLATAPGSVHVTVSAVGSVPVVLDADHATLTVPGEPPVRIPASPGKPQDLRVQQPGPANRVAYVASDLGLYAVPLGGGPAVRVWGDGRDQGRPAAPAFVAGCVHAAWAATHTYAYDCGTGGARSIVEPSIPANARLEFRVNRDVVVLNDTAAGGVWVQKGDSLEQVAHWTQLAAAVHPNYADNRGGKGPSNTSHQHRAPVAHPETFGARPGRTTVLPVLLFDSDPNGDLLTVTAPTSVPAQDGTVQIADHGTVLQFTPAPGETGSFTVPYTISDGLGTNDTATSTLTVTIDPPSVETPPVEVSATPVTVGLGKTVTFDALAGWYDREGDPFQLTGATVTGGSTVSFTPAGTVAISADGSPGAQTVTLKVADAEGQAATGTVPVDVLAAGTDGAPQTRPFLAQATAGVQTVLDPLRVDSDPNDVPMRLSSVTVSQQSAQVPGLVVTPDYQSGRIAFSAAQPGTYYLHYVATDTPPEGVGATSGPTAVRVDVANPAATAGPVAMRQVTSLAPGGSVLLPVLDTATDPTGGVLAVQSVTAPPGSPVEASVYRGDAVRLSTAGVLSAPQVLSYLISDGTQSATGEIDVLPAPPAPTMLPPVAEPLSVTVPAGTVAQIDPTTVDFDPAGAPLLLTPGSVKLDAQLTSIPGGDPGNAFVDGGIVRYQAPARTGQATVLYGVTDAAGQSASSSITIDVVPDQPATQPPVPLPLTASVVAGSQVTVSVPLAGIDPSGESVTLVGLATGPQLGSIVTMTASSFTYQAFPQSRGTDTFSYEVRDTSGLVGDGVVRIGIAPPAPLDEPPVAVPQTVTVDAGHTVDVPVLARDFDPQGYAISFVAGQSLVLHGLPAGSAAVAGTMIRVTGPPAGHHGVIAYQITDGHGAVATGVLTVVGSPAAPSDPPVAHDIVVPYLKDPSAVAVTVDVLTQGHVTDPAGSASDLRLVSVTGPTGTDPQVGGAQVTIRLGSQYAVLVYTVQGVDGTASATITVPPKGVDGPQLIPGVAPVTTPANTPVTVSIGTYLFDPGGRALRLTSSADLWAGGGSVRATSPTALVFTPTHDYVGPAAVTVQMTNGYGPDDPTGQVGVFTIPVEVTGTPPPVFFGPTVQAVTGQHASFDLAPYVASADGGPASGVTFGQPSAPATLGASISGSTLTVFPQHVTGVGLTVSFTVSDAGGQTTGTVLVDVVATNKPLAVAVPQTASVFQGKSVTVDVLTADVDPFPTPLVVSAPTVVSGVGSATTNGSSVTFTAGPSYVGTAVVAYTLTDQTKLASRQVQGTVTVTVSGVPGAPGAPSVLGFGNGTALLAWSAPPSNGQPIDQYTVSGGPASQTCTTTTCNITGLQNGTAYQFRVSAHNAVGDGPQSQPSAPVTPNQVPGTPLPPSVTFGDSSVTVTWSPPTDVGTPITCYQVAVSPAAGTGPSCVTGTRAVWTGLTNGDSYTFTVRAENALGFGPSSGPSAAVVPAGVPSAPGTPQVTAVPNDPTGGKLDVEWPAVTGPAANGADVTSYALRITQGSTVVRTDTVVPTSPTEDPILDSVSGLSNSVAYTFSVTATNKAGTSPSGPTTTPFTVFAQPGAVTNLAATNYQNGQTTLSFTPPASNGQSIQYYQYSENGGPYTQLGSNNVIGGLANGRQYSFVIEACNTYCGAPSNSATATPDAPPTAPVIGASVSGTTVSFSWGAASSNGCPVSSVAYSLNGGGYTGSSAPGSATTGGSYSTTYTITVRVTDSCGLSSTSSGSGTTGAPPPPPPPPTFSETETVNNTQIWSNPYNAGGSRGKEITKGETVQVSCLDTNTMITSASSGWYLIASSPWNSQYYAAANTFSNNGSSSGYDPRVPACG